MIASKEEFNDLLNRLKAKDKENKLGKSLQTKLQAFLEVEELINLPICGVSISLPSRKDYNNRKLKAMYFKKDTSVGNSVLFIKGEQWQPYNWNYDKTIEYLKEGRLGYEF